MRLGTHDLCYSLTIPGSVALMKLSLSLLALLGFLMVGQVAGEDEPPRFITVGSGGVAGVYHPAGTAICRLINEHSDEHGVRCSAVATSGSIYNLETLQRGELDFGIAQSDWESQAFNGTGRFTESGPFEELRSVIALHAEPLTIVARAESRIRNLRDLTGREVHAGAAGSTERRLLADVLDLRGVDMESIVFSSTTDRASLAGELCAGEYDALVMAVEHPSTIVTEASNACELTFFDISEPDIDALVARTPYYRKAIVPAHIYRGLDREIATFGVGAVVVSSSAISEDLVYLLVRSVFEEIDEFRRLHPVFGTLAVSEMIGSGMAAPLHEGAQRYYRELGWL